MDPKTANHAADQIKQRIYATANEFGDALHTLEAFCDAAHDPLLVGMLASMQERVAIMSAQVKKMYVSPGIDEDQGRQ